MLSISLDTLVALRVGNLGVTVCVDVGARCNSGLQACQTQTYRPADGRGRCTAGTCSNERQRGTITSMATARVSSTCEFREISRRLVAPFAHANSQHLASAQDVTMEASLHGEHMQLFTLSYISLLSLELSVTRKLACSLR